MTLSILLPDYDFKFYSIHTLEESVFWLFCGISIEFEDPYNTLVEFNTLLCHQIFFILFNIIALVTILYQKVILSTFDWVRITTIVDQMFMCGTTDSTIKKHSGARLLNQ